MYYYSWAGYPPGIPPEAGICSAAVRVRLIFLSLMRETSSLDDSAISELCLKSSPDATNNITYSGIQENWWAGNLKNLGCPCCEMIQGSEHTLDFTSQLSSLWAWESDSSSPSCLQQGKRGGWRAECSMFLKWFHSKTLLFMATFSLWQFSLMLSHNNSQEAHKLAKQTFHRSRRWSCRKVKKQMDGTEMILEVVAGLEFKSPSAHLSHLTSLSSPEPLPLNTDWTLAHGNTVVSAVILVDSKPAVPTLPRNW